MSYKFIVGAVEWIEDYGKWVEHLEQLGRFAGRVLESGVFTMTPDLDEWLLFNEEMSKGLETRL